MIITSPTEARKDFYQLLKNVNNNHEPIYISGNNAENNAVIIGLEDCTQQIQETMYLVSTGTMDKVREREKDNSGTTNIDDIDWDNL